MIMKPETLLAAAAALIASLAADARANAAPAWQPNAVFIQAGDGSNVHSVTAGLAWDWRWQGNYAIGKVTGYTEVEVSRWRTSGQADDRNFTQVGIAPVLRLYPRAWASGWFVEAGIGANAISPHYCNETRVFSTAFNFGDHIALGRRFGDREASEVSLRFQHFSNASIKRPNPGENFLQLRVMQRF
jgi:lipid A 3-O-deacylase